jgi:hypothetical protein
LRAKPFTIYREGFLVFIGLWFTRLFLKWNADDADCYDQYDENNGPRIGTDMADAHGLEQDWNSHPVTPGRVPPLQGGELEQLRASALVTEPVEVLCESIPL